MFTKILRKWLFPAGKLADTFPWTVQTAGKKYFTGLLHFAVGSFLVPGIVIGSIFALAYYPKLLHAFMEPGSTALVLVITGLATALLALAVNTLRLKRRASTRLLCDVLVATPYYIAIGLASCLCLVWGVNHLDPVFPELMDFVVGIVSTPDGQPNITFVMLLSLVSFVMGFGMQVRYIACELRKEGLSLKEAMALTFKPLKGSWWGVTLGRVVLAVGIAYGITYLIGETVVSFMGAAHQPTVELAKQASGGNFVLFALMAVVGAPIFEEIVFRGFLFQVVRCSLKQGVAAPLLLAVPQSGLRRAWALADNWVRSKSHAVSCFLLRVLGGKRADLSAVIISSLMFSLLHMQFQPTTLVLLFLLGCVQAEIYRRTGSLYCGMLLHALNNGIDCIKLALGQV